MKTSKALSLVLVVALVAACTANAVKTEYRVLGATVTTVDLAMNAWGAYVRSGAAKPEQEATVRTGFETYQNAARAAKVALMVGSNIETPAELAAAAQALVSIIETFTHKKVTP